MAVTGPAGAASPSFLPRIPSAPQRCSGPFAGSGVGLRAARPSQYSLSLACLRRSTTKPVAKSLCPNRWPGTRTECVSLFFKASWAPDTCRGEASRKPFSPPERPSSTSWCRSDVGIGTTSPLRNLRPDLGGRKQCWPRGKEKTNVLNIYLHACVVWPGAGVRVGRGETGVKGEAEGTCPALPLTACWRKPLDPVWSQWTCCWAGAGSPCVGMSTLPLEQPGCFWIPETLPSAHPRNGRAN